MKNKGKFFLKVILVAGITIISISSLFMHYSKSKEKNIRYETYIVKQGDTLWSIAKKYNKQGEDIRKLIYEIREHNNISPLIHEGQVIKIPIKE